MTLVLPWPHGTVTGYNSHGCRCAACAEASRNYRRELRYRHAATGLAADDARHGTLNAYDNHRCRCPRCAEAARQAGSRRRGGLR